MSHRLLRLAAALGVGLLACESGAVQPGTKLAVPWAASSDADQVRMAWILRAGDCLICSQSVHYLRPAERTTEGSATMVILIGESDDTLNIRQFLQARRIGAPIILWAPASLEGEWARIRTPDLLIVDRRRVLWGVNSNESRDTPLVVLREMRDRTSRTSSR